MDPLVFCSILFHQRLHIASLTQSWPSHQKRLLDPRISRTPQATCEEEQSLFTKTKQMKISPTVYFVNKNEEVLRGIENKWTLHM